jgi:hypothetical protein
VAGHPIEPQAGQPGEENQPSNNSENNSSSELFEGDKQASEADSQQSEAYRKKGKGGRERSYEKVRKVLLYKKKMGRYPPDLSKDMCNYYDWWYFTMPRKKKDGDDYERHYKAYERGQKWLA